MKTKAFLCKVGMVIVTCLLISVATLTTLSVQAAPGDLIQRVYTDKARYHPGDIVTITVEIKNNTGVDWSGTLYLDVRYLETLVHSDGQSLSIAAGATATKTFTWTTPSTDFRGYHVEVRAGTTDANATAIDVSSDWTRYPRYGFVYAFTPGQTQAQSQEKIRLLAENYHINAVQFYDWMWRHEQVISRTNGIINDPWYDWAGNPISFAVIQDLVAAAHNYRMAAMPYFMIYGALQNYQQISKVNPQWGLYFDTSHTNQVVFDFGDDDPNTNLWIFNPFNTNWQNYIFRQYDDAILTLDFDGIHLDQMGNYWNTTYYDYWGNVVDLGNSFSALINNAKEHVSALAYHTPGKMGKDILTFNMVNGGVNAWGVNDVVRNSNVNFLYSEIWENSATYKDIYDFVRQSRADSGGKAIVLAAYPNYYENTGPRYEAEDATLYNVGINNNHPGYTGTGFVDQFGEQGDYAQFSISVPEDGKYALVFRYANDTGTTSTRSVYVDGIKKAQLKFRDQVNWDTWARDAYYVVTLTAGSHTVKLSVDPGDSGFINLDSLTLGTFDEDTVRLANAAFAASGVFHIEMGEGDQMLGHPYFPNNSKQMRNSLKAAMKDYYDFITAYENLLFDPDLIPGDGGLQWISIANENISGDGSGNTIWFLTRRNANYDVLHLINLLGNDDQWRNEANTPPTKTDLAVKYRMGPNVTVSGVYLASPDIDHGKTIPLSFTTGRDGVGDYVSFVVPSLKYWDMIYIKRTFAPPSGDRYEAEDTVKTNVGVNNNHAGYSGTGFVDGFESINDGVSFVIYAPTEDDYYLRFRYANATGATATRNVYIDGQYAGRVTMKPLANWDTWGDGILTVRLKPGLHHVVLWFTSENSTAINLDYLEVRKAYVWTFNVQIDRIPDNYYITFKVGLPGLVHWGTNNWQNITDTWFVPNGSSNPYEDYEATIGPFSGDTEINFTFAWDDNNDGTIDRWENKDWSIGTNAPTNDYYQVEGITGNNYSFAQFDARGSLFDFMAPLGIWSGMKPTGNQLNIYKAGPGLKIGAAYYWLNDPNWWTYAQSYVPDTVTLVFTATHKTLPLQVVNTAFIPKNIVFPVSTDNEPIRGLLIQRFSIRNTGTSNQNATFIYFLDMNINGTDAQDSVSYNATDDILFYHDPGDASSGRTRTMDFGLAFKASSTGHKTYQITDAAYLAKDLSIAAGGRASVDVLLVGATKPTVNHNLYTSHIKPAMDWFRSANLDSVQSTTESYWTNLLANATTFESPDATYNTVYKRSLLIASLYFDADKGGMGAGSYNGNYFYVWPRDAVYGAVTLDRAGLRDVAAKVYDWLWTVAKRDKPGNDYGNDGVYYRFWYQKYTMDGEPEWWNPQVDETAIIPWGAWYHYLLTGDSGFITAYKDLVKEAGTVASEENPHVCLNYDANLKLMYSQNIWEDKWGYFLYSNATIVAGLRDGALFMDRAGDTATRDLFNSRKAEFERGIDNSLYNATTARYDHGRYVKKVGWCQDSGLELNRDVSADVSMLGLVVPFRVKAITETAVVNTLNELEPALTDFSETKMAYGGVVRYRADQEERYGADYRDHGDSYYDGGPWMMPTNWLSEYYLEWADTVTGTARIDTAKAYLDYVIHYLGHLGLGAEQIDENKKDSEFALEAAWANVWESNGKIVDNLLAFVDYEYNAEANTLKVAPKLPSSWNYLGSRIRLKNGTLYIKVTKGTNQHLVDLDNNTPTALGVEIYIQTDAQPTSVTGTNLSWSYDAATGRVKLYGTLGANTSQDIVINF